MNSKKNNSHGEKSTPINIVIHFVCNIPNVVFMFSLNLFSFSIYQWITDDAVAAINQQPWMEVKRWSTLTTSTFGFQLFWVRMLFLEYILSPCPTLTLFPIASSPTSPPPLPHPHVVAMLTSNLFLFSLYRWIFYVAPLQRSHNLNMNPTGWISRGAAAIDESQCWSTSTTSAFGFNFLSVFFYSFYLPYHPSSPTYFHTSSTPAPLSTRHSPRPILPFLVTNILFFPFLLSRLFPSPSNSPRPHPLVPPSQCCCRRR